MIIEEAPPLIPAVRALGDPAEQVPGDAAGQVPAGSAGQVLGDLAGQVPLGQAVQLPVGRAVQLPPGRARQVPPGRAEQLPGGRAEQLSVGRAEQVSVGRAERVPGGPAEQVSGELVALVSADPVGPVPYVLSGRTPAALRAQADRLAGHPATGAAPAAVASALVRDRASFATRAVVIAEDAAALSAGLRTLAAGGAAANIVSAAAPRSGSVGVVFGGQGSQRAGAGRRLYERFTVFRESFDATVALLDRQLGDTTRFSVRDIAFGVAGTEGLIDRTLYTQPVIFAVGVALYRLLESWGIEIAAVAGHSIGGVVAAHVAGALPLAEAARLVAARGRLMDSLPAGGAMTAVEATEDEVRAAIIAGGSADTVSVAAVNGPRAVVISGPDAAVAAVSDALSAAGRRTRRLTVSHAFHSAAMDPILDEFRSIAAESAFSDVGGPRIFSDHTGRETTGVELADPDHWVRHLRGTVRFADAARAMADAGVGTFVELSADAVLAPALSGTLDGSAVVVTLRRDRDEVTGLIAAAATLFTHGHHVDWTALVPAAPRTDLPTYAFQRQRYWVHAPAAERRTDGWIHRAHWEPRALADPASEDGRSWVLVVPDGAGEWAAALRTELTRRGAVVRDLSVDPATVTGAALAAGLAGVPGDASTVVSLLPLAVGAADADLRAATAALTRAVAAAPRVAALGVLTTGTEVPGDAPVDGDDPVAVRGAWHAAFTGAAVTEGGLGPGIVVDVAAQPDGSAAERVLSALRAPDGEREFAVRAARIWTRRLRPGDLPAVAGRWRPAGTVLVTGGTGALGARIARRLAGNGVTDLLLLSRRGPDAPGATELIAELSAAGARPVVVACDVGDRAALAAVLADIPVDRPLTDVVHAAAILDDDLVGGLDRDRIERVYRVKTGAALHLHELTRDRALSSFVLFSSVTGVIPAPGQTNYAPGNAALDALAGHRRRLGLPATSIVWGHWAGAGIAGHAAEQLRRSGLRPMDPEAALTALERAVVGGETHLVVADVDWTAADRVHAHLLTELLPPQQRSEPAVSTVEQLAALDDSERRTAVRALVREETAAALGHADQHAVDDDRGLRDQGFTSLSSVELRNRLRQRTGLELPATLVFDRPTVAALTEFILELVTPASRSPLDGLLGDLERIAAGLAAADLADADRAVVLERLHELAAPAPDEPATERTAALSDADLIEFIGSEFGIS
ncbi:type I polyketide synthase [Nocardia sp. BMG111209]|uniref:SDR family NAD(P)-dependent oxidoreductase n=1 Tax=Nocardia sp. BMG111209 TaxID=1160137 RepID=UPI001E2D2CAF